MISNRSESLAIFRTSRACYGLVWLAMAMLSACAKLEPGTAAKASFASESASLSTPAPANIEPEPEPPLPAKALPKIADHWSIDYIWTQMPYSGNRGGNTYVIDNLDNCFRLLSNSDIVYDTRDIVPLVPDAVHANVAGDVYIQSANVVNLSNIDGKVTVENAELIQNAWNFDAPLSIRHSFTARLIDTIQSITGSFRANILALRSATNIDGNIELVAHAVGDISLEHSPGLSTVKHACIMAQDIDSISSFVGSLVVLGRGEGGDSGNIGSISRIDGPVTVVGSDVKELLNIGTASNEPSYFEQSFIGSIDGHFNSPIYLNASKVDSLTNHATSAVDVYLANGSEVAHVFGAVNLIKVN